MDAGARLKEGAALLKGEATIELPDGCKPLVTRGYRPSRGTVPARDGRGGGVDEFPLLAPAVRPCIAAAAFPNPAEYLFGFGDTLADPFPCVPMLPDRLGEFDDAWPPIDSRLLLETG
jgi:hypothetical protein